MKLPKYKQIASDIQGLVDTQKLGAGDLLPTEKELMSQYDVSRVTIRKALAELESQEVIVRISGKGTYINGSKARRNALELKGFLEDIHAQGKQPSSRVLDFKLTMADASLAQKLSIEINMPVYAITRLRLINDEPEILEHTFMPAMLFPELSIDIMNTSKYEYIEKDKGLKIALSRETVVAEVADQQLADTLNVEVGYPLIKVMSIGELEDGTCFEYSENYFTSKQFSFEIMARR
ncbi:GntR family transcriptional regulator [Photobacterium rosenbergii]|uniref:GntR family transcriptional regulator n=1 Tax=Photobacterium rosenbergii TaxID=294936 RepID=A0ABU3ZIQ4_9GAMM|nr:GntR family transcriptional regulator [Photobacterium rosenbergii]MDV5170009.1 GntR family transcriptional regulator [Photobacterium rosenbergii]